MLRYAAIRHALIATVLCTALTGCLSPAASIALALIPDGTFSTLLGNLQGVEDSNRKQLAELAAQNDWAGIARFAEQNIAIDPTNADWWMVAGYAHTQLKQYPRANQAFAEAVRLSPDNMDAWNMLGQSYRALGQPERAIRTFDNALRVSRESPMTYFLLGESFRDLKRPDRAVAYYEQAAQRDPQFTEAWYALGQTYWRLDRRHDYEQVIEVLRKLDAQAANQLAALDVSSK